MNDKYYETYFDLFISAGWKQYVSEAKENYDAIDLTLCKSWDDYMRLRTEKIMLSRIVNFEDYIKTAYEVLKEREMSEK